MTEKREEVMRVWRATRLAARHLDRTDQFWYLDPRVREVVTNGGNDLPSRCWYQVWRQRVGE